MNLLQRGMGAANDFVDVLRQVRTDEIEAEASRHFQIAIVGPRGAGKTTLIGRLAAGTFGGVLEPFGLRRIVELDTPLGPDGLDTALGSDLVIWLQDVTQPYDDPTFVELRASATAFLNVANKSDLVIDAVPPAERALLISGQSADSVRQELAPAVLDCLPDLGLALGRQLSAFRLEAANREIARVARVNAEVAVVSAIPQASLILGPASVLADTLILTKNQGMLMLRLASMYGLSLDKSRLVELAPVVGAAFGWRTLARELVGFLPAGFGVVPKAVIAYAGTVAAGRAAMWYYQTGRKMPAAQFDALRAASLREAKEAVKGIAAKMKIKKAS
ncbi:MAG: hypothetical protein JO247_11680 [Chloroflexi bacterium]|nr:hypothetical protein [Chloroflexota bacterium]